MQATELVDGLSNYVSLLNTLEKQEHEYLLSTGNVVFSKVVLSYQTISMKLEVTRSGAQFPSLYLECKFDLSNQGGSLKSIYCENEERESDIKEFILRHLPNGILVNNEVSSITYDLETVRYLSIADEIAKEAYLCSHGDDYRPGYYSEVLITEKQIILRQINRMNARSRDHKENYYLRDLEFFIPLTTEWQKASHGDERIGRMVIHFSDRSSEQNKICGNKIKQKIEEELLKFID
jgi:hypothetical protein